MDKQEFERLDENFNRSMSGMQGGFVSSPGLTYAPVSNEYADRYMQYVYEQGEADNNFNTGRVLYNSFVVPLVRGFQGSLQGALDTNKDRLGKLAQDENVYYKESEYAQKTREFIKYLDNASWAKEYDVVAKDNIDKAWYALVGGGGQLAAQALIAYATGGIGATLAMGSTIYGNEYLDLRNEKNEDGSHKVTVEDASNASLTNAIIQTPMEMLSLSKLFKAIPVKNTTLRKQIMAMLERGATEGATEFAQQYPEEITQFLALNKDKSNEELWEMAKEKQGEWFFNALVSGSVGAVLGGLGGSINLGFQRVRHSANVDNVKQSAEVAVKKGVELKDIANTINANMGGETVEVDGEALQTYFQQTSNPEEAAQVLGVTVEEVAKAAENGETVDIMRGEYTAMQAKDNTFVDKVEAYSSFDKGEFSPANEDRRKALAKEYRKQLVEQVKRNEGWNVQLDEMQRQAKAAGVKDSAAKEFRTLLRAVTFTYNPYDPTAYLRKHPLIIRGVAEDGSPLLQRGLDITTENFRNWFKESKIVDDKGMPLMVYHGTGTPGIEVFDKKKAQDKAGRAMALGQGKGKFYFATTEIGAKNAAEGAVARGQGKTPTVMPVYLRVENPVNLDEYKRRYQELSGHELNESYAGDYTQAIRDKFIAKLDKTLQNEGVDGIYDKDMGFVAVFDGNQIKSAIANNGDYSLTDNNIYHQNNDILFDKDIYHNVDTPKTYGLRAAEGAGNVVELKREYLKRIKGEEPENTLYIDSHGVRFTEQQVRHSIKEHSLTDEELLDVERHIDTLYNACFSNWSGGEHIGIFGGASIVARIDGKLSSYYVTLEVTKDNTVYFKTAAPNSKIGVDNKIRESGATRLPHYENGIVSRALAFSPSILLQSILKVKPNIFVKAKDLQSFDEQMKSVREKYYGTDRWMKAPNGEDSNLPDERIWCAVRTENFKAWFGDWENDSNFSSQALDNNGEPMMLFHGTKTAGFNEFEDGTSIFMTSNKDVAAGYSNGSYNTMSQTNDPVDLNIYKKDVHNILIFIRKYANIELKRAGRTDIAKYIGEQLKNDILTKDFIDKMSGLNEPSLNETEKLFLPYVKKYLQLTNDVIESKGVLNDYRNVIALRDAKIELLEVAEKNNIHPLKLWPMLRKTFGYRNYVPPIDLDSKHRYFTPDGVLMDEASTREYAKYLAYSQEKFSNGIYELFGNVKNPLVIDAGGRHWQDIAINVNGNKLVLNTDEIVEYAKQNGYDGVIINNVVDENLNYQKGITATDVIAFAPNNVKSVNNEGSYSNLKKNMFLQESNVSQEEPQSDLVSYHNITEGELLKALEFGGFPVPSIAVMKSDVPYDKYGGITLVGTPELIDPAKGVPVYAKDGYTITFPKPSYAIPKISVVRKFKEKWKQVFYDVEDGYSIDSIIDHYKNTDSMVNELRDSFGFEYYYLTKVLGKKIDIPVNEYTPRMPILKKEKYFNKLNELYEGVDKYDDLDAWEREIGKVVEEYYDEKIARIPMPGIRQRAIFEKEKVLKDGKVDNYELTRIFKEIEEYHKAKNNPGKDYRQLKHNVRTKYSDIIYGNDYYKWVDKQIEELVGEGKVKIGNRFYPFNLANVTKYMVKNAGAAAEASWTFSAGKVAALAAQKFKSIAEMHKAEGKLGTDEEFNASADKAKEIGDNYRVEIAKYKKYDGDFIFDAFDEAMESLAKAADDKGYTTKDKLRKALAKTDAFKDNIPDEVLQLGVDYLQALTDTTTQYFEAKPQRAVTINDFAGVVVPKGTSTELINKLIDSGVTVREYDASVEGDRQRVTQELAREKDAYFQGQQGKTTKGGIQWSNKGTAYINIFKHGDASTIIHEGGHFFVENLINDVLSGECTEQQRKDAEALMRYCGITLDAWEGMDFEARRPHHEKLAEAFESYLIQGKAPSKELRSTFQKFSEWIKNIYKLAKEQYLNGNRNEYAKEIDDEVISVFDHMLASDEEIKQMEKINGYLASLPKSVTDVLSDRAKKQLESAMEKAHDTAVNMLTKQSMVNFTNERKEQIDSYRADMLNKYAEEVAQEPLYMAIKEIEQLFAKNAKMVAKSYIQGKEDLTDIYRDGGYKLLDVVAENHGFSSGDELVHQINDSRTEAQEVKARVDAAVQEKFPDVLLERKRAEQAAKESFYNDDTGVVIALEQVLIEEAQAKAIAQSRSDAAEQRLRDENAKKKQEEHQAEVNARAEQRKLEKEARDAEREKAKEQHKAEVEARKVERAAKKEERLQAEKERRERAKIIQATMEIAAEEEINKLPVFEAIRVEKYITAERNAAAKAAVALTKKDYEKALQYKRIQAFNHAMVRHSLKAKQTYQKGSQVVKALSKNLRYMNADKKRVKWFDEDNYNQAASFFIRMGGGLSEKYYDPSARTESFNDYLNRMAQTYDNVDVADWLRTEDIIGKPRELSMSQYTDVIDAIKNLNAIVRAAKGEDILATAKDFETLKNDIVEQLSARPDKWKVDINEQEKPSFAAQYFAGLQNMDSFFEKMDEWEYGFFTKLFAEKVTEATDKEFRMMAEFQRRLGEARDRWYGVEKADGIIGEGKYDYKVRQAEQRMDEKFMVDELGTSVNKHILVKMLMYLGSESSSNKLCSNKPNSTYERFFNQSTLWTDDVSVTRDNLLAMLGKYLTAEDVRYAQEMTDCMEMYWDELAAVERRTKGFRPKKVNALPAEITLADGTNIAYRGGYVPLIRRREISVHSGADMVDMSTANRGDGIKTMHTNTGATKARDSSVYPLDLRKGVELNAIQDSVHDICFRELVAGYRKMINDPELYNLFKSKLGVTDMNVLEEFLKKVAKPYGDGGAASLVDRGAGNYANWMRSRVVNTAIVLNLKTAVQNFSNIALYGNVVDGFTNKDVAVAMKYYINGSSVVQGNTNDFVMSKSAFMAERMGLIDVTMRDIQDGILDVSWASKEIAKVGQKLLVTTDNFTAIPVWLQAYSKKLNEGATDEQAVMFADTVIRRTLGSSRITDVAPYQRGSAQTKLLTVFQSFFITQYNQLLREIGKDAKMFKEGYYAKAAANAFIFFVGKWLAACLMNIWLAGDDPFEEDKKGHLNITKELLHYPVSMLGYVGQGINFAIDQGLDIENYGVRGTAIDSVIKSFGNAIGRTRSGLEKGEYQGALEAVTTATGLYFNVPAQVNKIFWNGYDVMFNDMEFMLQDLLKRRPKRER